MLRDVFYYGSKPNAHPREQFAENLADARQKCTTEHFWIINEFCDYRNFDWDFDFEFLPDEDVWAEDHNNVWPSKHQKDSGTWLCAKDHSDTIIYRNDVGIVSRKNEKQSDFWVELDLIDPSKFDFSWHPDPTDPPYIYKWGCKFFPAVLKHVLEYRVPGATQEKYMTTTVELLPQTDYWVEHQAIDKHKFDMSWRPNPLDPPFIYIWGNKYVDGKLKSTLEYHSPEATDKKYMSEQLAVLPEWDKWVEVQSVDKTSFDFSWRPDPREPDLIYVFGNEHYDAIKMPTVEYHCDGATERKYMDTQVAKLAPNPKLYEHLEDSHLTDYSWLPDPDSPPYIYVWGNQWNAPEDKISVQLAVPGATEYTYMPDRAIRKPCMDNWNVPEDVDITGFDFSWEPNPAAPPYIYEFATQWQKTGGPQYIVPGATEKQYVDFQKVKKLPSSENWKVPENIDSTGFDFSWHPDDTSPPYNYVFATQWAFSGGPVYTVDGATEIKYVDDQVATAKKDKTNWVFDESLIDIDSFDFSWHPYVEDQPYIYEFGTQWQKTGGPKYITPGADSSSPIKYIDTRIIKAERLPNKRDMSWVTHLSIKEFDYSWHPDNTDEPYIYVFGNNLYPAEECSTIEYRMSGATQVKYVNEIVATLDVDMDNWEVPFDIDTSEFDFSWLPNPNDPPYIYQFGTQWQKTGGPRYVVDAATEVKYLDFQKTIALHTTENWKVSENIEVTNFDFSWHPDDTDPPYIYQFGTQWALSGGPKYIVEGATEIKYVDELVATSLPDKTNWVFDETEIDVDAFDFSWHPYVEDQPYIYEFGTQWQKTGGPKYITPGADSSSPTKYIDTRIIKSKRLPNSSNDSWKIINDYKIKDFDFSWHPDNTDESYIYVFGNNQYSAEECATIEYHVLGATERKYVGDIVAILDVNTNWNVPDNIDSTGFDFTWVPNPNDPLYIYEFGTQHQKTGGPTYVVPGATEIKYLDFQKVIALPNKDNWTFDLHTDTSSFDFSWHPDATDPPYIYAWGNQWVNVEDRPSVEYTVSGATEYRYMEGNAIRKPCMDNWIVPDDVDVGEFDFSWEPSPKEEPYIYQVGTQWQKTGGPRYVVPGATDIKYLDSKVTKLPSRNDPCWTTNYKIKDFDWSWHPDNTDEPYIYVFGNTLYPAEECATIEYRVPGATAVKFISDIVATLDVDMTNWDIPKDVDVTDFDFSWVPNPNEPDQIYQFSTQWQKTGGPRYVVPGATEIKYLDFQKVVSLPNKDNWKIPSNVDIVDFDFSWHPDDTDPAYIYQFGTQWALSGGPAYHVSGATEIKYMDEQTALALPNKDNWVYDPTLIDAKTFDFSWHPYAEDQPYIYEFGTQWQKTGGPKYITPGADSSSPIKYIDTRILKAKRLPNKANKNWISNYKIKDFDYSWHPDSTEEPYIYVFGNNLYPAEECATIEYHVASATEKKYVRDIIATLGVNDNWEIPTHIDTAGFDFSWVPNPNDPPYIYEFGTQWQKTSGPRYAVSDATEIKYLDFQKVIALPNKDNWKIPPHVDIAGFDFSWHPDNTDPEYIYQFGTQWALSGGPAYCVPNATEVKYMDEQTAIALPNKDNWVYDASLIDIDKFDFSWHPYVEDQPYIYEFGTQWQKTGGPKYITPGADSSSPIKYIDTRIMQAVRLPNRSDSIWHTLYNIKEFDWSWHPDNTDEPYIYVFGNNLYPAEECATVEYRMPNATQTKYISDVNARLGVDMENWVIPENVDTIGFDFSWIPNPSEPAYIYEFGTQWQKTGGPKYIVEGSTETKYVDFQKVTILPNNSEWYIPDNVDTSQFDFSWHPDDTEPAYIYQFGTQWALSGGPKYEVSGATEIKYMDILVAKALPDRTNWEYDETEIDVESFDFSWHPYVEDQPYVYQFGTQWQKTGGPKYITPGADLDSPVKYIDTRIIKARRLADAENTCWVRNYPIRNFDYSWHPDETEDPYIYVFGNNQFLAEECATIEYRIPGATTIKYIPDIIARLDVNMDKWVIPDDVDATDFDFSWIPNPTEPAYIYEFGTQWQKTGGPKYAMPGAWRGTKYVDVQTAKRLPDYEHWTIPDYIDKDSFDFSWHPDATEEPYIYVFATQWAFSGGPVYTVPGATEIKYVDEQTAKALPNRTNWEFDETLFDVNEFDFSWHPYVEDQPYIYQFGTQWWETGGPRYVTPGTDSSSPIKYIDTRIIKSMTLARLDNWEIPEGVDVRRFDFSWIPHPKDPPYIYQFGTKVDNNEGPRYINSNASGEIVYLSWVEKPEDTPEDNSKVSDVAVNQYYINTTLEDLVNEHPNEIFWAMQRNINYDNFDFDWRPGLVEVAWELNYVHVFGSPDSELTQTYFVSAKHFSDGNTDLKFVEELSLTDENLVELFIKPDMFFVDRGNLESTARFEALKAKFGTRIQKTRYLNSWVDTINRCTNRATSSLLWVLNSELDYTDFNFDYYPNPWQMKMVHVFGTQWSHWGTTFMVNCETFREDTKYINIIEHLSNLNFVKEIRATATRCVHDIVIIDHGNKELADVSSLLQTKASGKTVTTVSYQESYLKTFKDIVARQQAKKEHYIWVCSSVCDYSNFDFSYVCDPFSRDNLHVFPSGKQKFGDTFFIDVNNAKEVIKELDALENFNKVNYNAAVKAARLPEPVIVTNDDTHHNAASKITDFPYITLITSDNSDIGKVDIEPMNLWSAETKNIYVTSTGATRIVVPKEIKDHVTKELYEYPYIKRAPKLALSKPLDIVFLSNGETGADENYEHLLQVTKDLPNRVVRVDGVNSRVAAYHAAAEASETPWMFTVFAKLKVSPKFDWNWQPDRMQSPKHYIFHAKNPVNRLTYGHQAMIAYNKKLTLANDGKGLDFTLDDEHEVVPLISGTAQYNTDEFSTWRTAFREVIKLRADDSEVSKERLDAWLNKAEGDFAQYSIKGALDADEYYDEVDGDFNKLKLSYEWAWLREKFDEI